MMKPRDLAVEIARILDEKQASGIMVLEVKHLTSIADYFIIASGRNVNHVHSLSEDVREKLEEKGVPPRRTEGERDARWIVLDYASVIVHIFHPEEREYYNIERLWLDGSNEVPFGVEEEK